MGNNELYWSGLTRATNLKYACVKTALSHQPTQAQMHCRPSEVRNVSTTKLEARCSAKSCNNAEISAYKMVHANL